MNKSMMLFLSGIAVGVTITAVALTGGIFGADKGSGAGGDLVASPAGDQSTQEQLRNLAEITAKLSVTAGALKHSADSLNTLTLPFMIAKATQKPLQSSPANAVQANLGSNEVRSEPATPPVQPSPQQVNRFTEIRSKLANAANNHAIPLSALIQEANDLTPEQHQQLADEALDMIKRGELAPEQFSKLPSP